MPAEPKRLPGEPNRSSDAPVVNPHWASGGRGNDYGLARALFAIFDYRKRRKAIKDRQPQGHLRLGKSVE